MSEALLNCQREDGFWGVSLAAPTNTGNANSPGPETSGTALFVAGMAYGIHTGILDKNTYLPAVIKAWNAMCVTAVHEDGFLGYVQGSGADPEDGQPVQYDKTPDFEDFGIGCFLLAAAEVYQLGDVDLSGSSVKQKYAGNDSVKLHCEVQNGELLMQLSTEKQAIVSLDIYDMLGALIKRVCHNFLLVGKHHFSFPVKGLSGSYVCALQTPLGQQTPTVIVVK
jgi:hypothetical protein